LSDIAIVPGPPISTTQSTPRDVQIEGFQLRVILAQCPPAAGIAPQRRFLLFGLAFPLGVFRLQGVKFELLSAEPFDRLFIHF